MDKRYYMGIDIGSSSLKGVLVDEDGMICSSGLFSYDIDQPKPGWAEGRPEVWWTEARKMLVDAFRDCPAARKGLRGVFISGMVPNLVALDQDGISVRPAILYRDNRAVQECDTLNARFGLSLNMQDVVPKWYWIKQHEPETFGRIHTILNTHSYIIYQLTGVLSTDSDIASLMGDGFFQPQVGWNHVLLDRLGLPAKVLPEAFYPGEVVGYIRDSLAQEMELTVPVPVFAGNGDSLASMLGTGVVDRGDAMIYLGTAATLWYMEENLADLAKNEIFGSGKLHFVGNTLTGGELLRWFRYGLQIEGNQLPFSELEEQARAIPAGAHGLMALPHFMGARTPKAIPDAWGSLLGLTPSHNAFHIYRALMEAVAYNLRDSYEVAGWKADRLVVTGGGAASRLWREILANVFQHEILYYPRSDASLGNAYFAGYALGDFKDFDGLQRWLGKPDICKPDQADAEIYEKFFCAYRKIDGIMTDCYEILKQN